MKHFFPKFDTPSLLLTFRGEINPNLIIVFLKYYSPLTVHVGS